MGDGGLIHEWNSANEDMAVQPGDYSMEALHDEELCKSGTQHHVRLLHFRR